MPSRFRVHQTPDFVANPAVVLETPKFDFVEVETPTLKTEQADTLLFLDSEPSTEWKLQITVNNNERNLWNSSH